MGTWSQKNQPVGFPIWHLKWFLFSYYFFWTTTTSLKCSIYTMKHEYNTFWFLLKKRKTSRGCNFSSVSLKHWESLWLRNGVLQVLPCNRVIMGSLLLESQIFLHPLKTLSLKVYHSSNMFSPFSPPTPASLLYLLHFFLIFFNWASIHKAEAKFFNQSYF